MKFSKLMSSKDFQSSFLSCEKDLETILRKLFVDSKPYSSDLTRLLVISNKDCLDDKTNPEYISLVNDYDLAKLREKGFIKLEPRLEMLSHESIKSYLVIQFNTFSPNDTNPYYRDVVIDFNIICHTDYWDLGNYRSRPIKIMGYIDGILNNSKLSGIGTLQFLGANEIVLDETLSGYLLRYMAVHGSDDAIEVADEV